MEEASLLLVLFTFISKVGHTERGHRRWLLGHLTGVPPEADWKFFNAYIFPFNIPHCSFPKQKYWLYYHNKQTNNLSESKITCASLVGDLWTNSTPLSPNKCATAIPCFEAPCKVFLQSFVCMNTSEFPLPTPCADCASSSFHQI